VIGTAWLLAGVFFAVIVFLAFWRFLQHLPAATRARSLIAGGLYIAGAIGVEAVGSIYSNHHGSETLTYEMLVALEEGLEMGGVLMFFNTLMLYAAREAITFEVIVDSGLLPETFENAGMDEIAEVSRKSA
jgi:hypothetical protein